MYKNIDELLDKLRECTGCATFAELAEKLKIPMDYFIDASRIGKIHPEILRIIACCKCITYEELLYSLGLEPHADFIASEYTVTGVQAVPGTIPGQTHLKKVYKLEA